MTPTEQAAAGRRAPATRDLLYEAATALFVERGYEDTTMADIAQRAGTSRRTAFNHFPSKGDIPMLWTRRMADRAVEVITEATEEAVPERVRAYFRLISRMVEAEPELSRQMMLGWTAAGGPIRYESQLLADLTPLLRNGQERGEVDPGVDVAEAARTLSDVYAGVIFRWVRDPDTSRTLQTTADSAIDLVLSAIRAGGRTPSAWR
ncbi:TetR/AcrR family transcriptional regulator [Amycolatopsis keratiniphila]|uniref:TetR family transcriptional regulator n=1 Tax=Amycolatopsis keratiniphila TaxID=129921 RepID=R4T0C0_9PSEU|nr:TetR/AcrR family transcriptional regulator [Amycolatopsis keratiniphila]AGM04148.1 TetR family transcriptional regulator [Amycolatopsis keratiniphila]